MGCINFSTAANLTSLATANLHSFPFIPTMCNGTNTGYDWQLSTEENYQSNNETCHRGNFQSIRNRLDYDYHSVYSPNRQNFQDAIVQYILDSFDSGSSTKYNHKSTAEGPSIVFTAGAMGVGKTYTINSLRERGELALESHVSVDIDYIRQLLPEFHGYLEYAPERAGELTHKEASLVAEILTEAALERGHDVLVDGSLKNATWHEIYFKTLRLMFPGIKIGIIHVTAPEASIIQRAKSRGETTGRRIPEHVLLESIREVPKAVNRLKFHVDFLVEVNNGASEVDVPCHATLRNAETEAIQVSL